MTGPTRSSGTTTRPVAATRAPRADARRNRAALLTAAERAFAERGTSASLEDIAARAGVGIGTLYRHFPNRDALIESLIHDRALELIWLGEKLAGAEDPFEALTGWLRASIRHAMSFQGLAASLVDATCQDPAGPLADICHRQEAIAGALLKRAQDAGQVRPDVTADDVVDLASSVAWVAERRGRRSPGHILDVGLDGLRPQPAEA
jgi:AcrR family transcriptional regulator